MAARGETPASDDNQKTYSTMARSTSQFQTIRSEGALLPPDVLQAIAAEKVDGADPAGYHLPPGIKISEAIAHSWNVLKKYWKAFQEIRCRLPEDDTGTEATNRHWLLPLFEELKYGRLVTVKAPEIDGRVYPIERFYAHVPIHLIGCNLPLDRRTKGARGAATASPHSMMQEYLNRSKESLWGFFSNGLLLRILRDNVSLSRQAFVEFDLEAMMEGEVYADFALLWMLCHQSRVEGERPQDAWLEKWSQLSREQSTRVLADLRKGVKSAIEALGRGFISHPCNDHLREELASGRLDKQEYYRQVLRIVYRLLFLFVAEDRGLLHGPEADPAASALYDEHYSTRRLRELADQIRGSKHADLWHSLALVFDALGCDGCPQLGLPALGSFLWRRESTAALLGPAGRGAEPVAHPVYITNDDLLAAIRALAFVEQGRARRSVDYRNLGSEELGSVYESLLELHPEMNIPGRTFALNEAAGHERKTTGSYYTPDSLVKCLLDSALEPAVAERITGKPTDEAARAILDLKVCDPACGSGHFLIAAAHRLARHLARLRSGEAEPSPADYQHGLRDVIGHCVYGVDINPMAVELCKVSLWMEALEPGKPLSFLDHHIQCGNSLLGATPALLAKGIPDEAFEPIEGDDKKLCREYKKLNRDERRGQQRFDFDRPAKPWERLGNAAVLIANLDTLNDDSLEAVRSKEERYAQLVGSADYLSGRFLADTWCAAFVWKKTSEFDYAITEDVFRRIERNPHDCTPWMREEIQRLAGQYQFFHWHLGFPQVFLVETYGEPENVHTRWSCGFDVVLGNPPWDALSPDAKEFFSAFDPSVRFQDKAGQSEIIDRLLSDRTVEASWDIYCRRLYASVHFFKNSGHYNLYAPGNLGKGDFNVFRMFVENAFHVAAMTGWAAQIVPEGLYNGANCMAIRKALFDRFHLDCLFGFENARENWFKGIDSRAKFCLYAARKGGTTQSFRAAFCIKSNAELANFTSTGGLSYPVAMVHEFSPDALAIAEFKSQFDINIAAKIYSRCPTLGDEEAGPPVRN